MTEEYVKTGGVEMQFIQPANAIDETEEHLTWVSFGDIRAAGYPIDDEGDDLVFTGKYRVAVKGGFLYFEEST